MRTSHQDFCLGVKGKFFQKASSVGVLPPGEHSDSMPFSVRCNETQMREIKSAWDSLLRKTVGTLSLRFGLVFFPERI